MERFGNDMGNCLHAGCFAFRTTEDACLVQQEARSLRRREIAVQRLAREATVLPWFRDRALPEFDGWQEGDASVSWAPRGYVPVVHHPAFREADANTILQFFARMCEAVEALHGDGIAHGALFPAGLWADPELERFKFCDTSLASRLDARNVDDDLQRLLCEEDFMRLPPDLDTAHDPRVGALSDIHGLGQLCRSVIEAFGATVPASVFRILDELKASPAKKASLTPGVLAARFRALSEKHDSADFSIEALEPFGAAHIVSLPQNLAAGREEIVASMCADLEQRIATTLCVRGPAGIGKSTVAREFLRLPTAQSFVIAQARCEPARQTHSWSVWRKLARDLAGKLALQETAVLHRLRQNISRSFAFEAKLLQYIMPELQTLFGLESEDRLRTHLSSDSELTTAIAEIFLQITDDLGGLVLSIDDLHWADERSMRVLEHLLSMRRNRPLFLLVMSRDGYARIDELLQRTAKVYDLDVVDRAAVEHLLRSTLGQRLDRGEELAAHIHSVSNGHPLFLTQIIHAMTSDGTLVQDRRTRRWTWRGMRLSDQVFSDNLKDLLSDRIRKAPEAVQQILHAAICLPDDFDLSELANCLGAPTVELGPHMDRALARGLMIRERAPDGKHVYRFMHDWLRRAARAELSEEAYADLKSSIGLRLLEVHSDDTRFDRIVVELMSGYANSELTVGQKQSLGQAMSRLACAERRRLNFDHAEALFERALALLGQDCGGDLEKMLLVASERVICAHALKRPEVVETLIVDALSKLDDPMQATSLVQLRCTLLTQEESFDEALRYAARHLRKMGVGLPVTRAGAMALVAVEVCRLSLRLGIAPLERLAQLRPSRNRRHMARIELLRTALNPAYFVAPEILMVGGLKILRHSLIDGRVPGTAVGEAIYALAVSVFLGRRKLGFDLGEAAMRESRHGASDQVETQVVLIHGHFVRFWAAPLREGIGLFGHGYDLARRDGDQLYSNFHILGMIAHNSAVGANLNAQREIARWGISLMERSNDLFSLRTARTWNAISEFLVDPVASVEPKVLMTAIDAGGSSAVSECYRLIKLCSLHWYSDRIPEACAAGATADRLLWRIPGQVAQLEHFLFYGLSLALSASEPGLKGAIYGRRLRKLCRKLKRYRNDAPETFSALTRLLQTKFGQHADSAHSVATLEKLAEDFKAEERMDLAAVTMDLAARIMSRAGLDKNGTRAGRAAALYEAWGGKAQAQRVRTRAGLAACIPNQNETDPMGAPLSREDLRHQAEQALEILSKAQTPDALIEGLLELSPALVNASYSAIVTQTAGALQLDMHSLGRNTPELVGLSAEGLGAFRTAVLRLVGTTGRPLFGELANDPIFASQAGAEAFNGKCIGCIPLVGDTRVIGMIYLEMENANSVTTKAGFEQLTFVIDDLKPLLDRFSMQNRLEKNSRKLLESSRKIALLDAARAKFAHFVPEGVRKEIECDPFLPIGGMTPKDVTAMFIDVEDFTGLSSRMSPDEVAALLRMSFSALLEPIYSGGGEICETTGDGLLIVYQAENTEEHARAAVASARNMREINRASLAGETNAQADLVLNFGINTGIALVGLHRFEANDRSRWVFTATGQVINVAARHVDWAKGGEIVIGAETKRRIGNAFETSEIGKKPLKGLAAQSELYSVF